MSSRANRAAIGFFVLGALMIVAIGLAVFFGANLGQKKLRMVMVFQGSVTGLDVGTPIEFRGVRVGEVKQIRAIYDTKDKKLRFAVYGDLTESIEIDGSRSSSISVPERRELFRDMIKEGLRARLETKSFVTGQQRVMLDFFPDTVAELTGIEPDIAELPTVRSPGEELIDELREIPFREAIHEGRKLVTAMHGLMETPDGKPGPLPQMLSDTAKLARTLDAQAPGVTREWAKTNQELRVALAEARRMLADTRELVADARAGVDRLSGAVEQVAKRVDSGGQAIENAGNSVDDTARKFGALAGRVEQSLDRLNETLARINHTLSQDSPLAATLNETLKEVGDAANSLRSAAELLQRRPQAILKGREEDVR